MIVAAIGDVHANLPALEAVIAHAQSNGAQAFWNIGDFVGYGAFPEEVVVCLRELGAISIQGNYDRKVLKVKKKQAKWQKSKAPEKWVAFQWAYDHLSKKSRKYLRSLPEQKLIQVDQQWVLLVHGSPAAQDEPLTLDTPDDRLRQLAAMTPVPLEASSGTGVTPVPLAKIVICGHSHQPFTRLIDNTYFINTGSVGRPDDGDPRAAYALLKLASGQVEVTHHRIEYDVQRAIRAICENGLPEDFARMLVEGRSLDNLQSQDHPCS